MKNIKLFLLIVALFLVSTQSFADWTQPPVAAPNGNTLPPINVSGVLQTKTGVIEAYGFCIVKSNGDRDCLGSTSTSDNPVKPVNGAPFEFDGVNVKNTNTGNVNLGASGDITGISPIKRLNVKGGISTDDLYVDKFCIGTDCGTSWSDIYNNYIKSLITNIGGSGDVTADTSPTVNYLTKWKTVTPTSKVITNSLFYEEAGKICIGTTAATKVCIGNTSSTDGLNGLPGKDGEVLSCAASAGGNVLTWNGTAWVCQTPSGGAGTVVINNPGHTPTTSGTVNRIPKFTSATGVGDSNLSDDATYITNLKPIKTSGGLIIENRTNDSVPTTEVGRIWIRTDL